ncbi:MAG: hypothetical protein U0075_10565 [Thermomicrobiales bacterium]
MTMTTPTIDALALQTARLSRRRSLLTLGGTVIASVAATGVEPGLARKNRQKDRSGKGADCQKKEQQRCTNDVAACKATVQPLCNADNAEECLAIQTCCEECAAAGFLACLLAAQQV